MQMITLDFMMFSVICFFLVWILFVMKEMERCVAAFRRECVIFLSEQSFRMMSIEESLKNIVKISANDKEMRS